ncbi:MAG: molybdenum cofactor synthesis domain-containing protein [Candidatus Methanospirareceae archaeon]
MECFFYGLDAMTDKFLEIKEINDVERIIAKVGEELEKNREIESVSIEEALGRVPSEDIFSPIDVPPFDRATMDGYAVVAADTFYSEEDKPSLLRVKGHVRAGDFPYECVERGSCMGISTGAAIPKGADAVVKVEHAEEFFEDGRRMVRIYKAVAPAENIMFAGSDIKKGERIVREGEVLTPKETGMLAACGVKEIKVYKKPVVAIISTGDELIPVGEELEPGKIYDINSYTIADSVRVNGGVVLHLGIARDEFAYIASKIKEGLEKKVDMIIISGGTSAGAGDILPEVIKELGEVMVHGVDIKPGKPFVFGIIQNKPIFGLPGNPTSALITFNLFVAPLLRRMGGRGEKMGGRCVKAIAGERMFSERGRNEFLLVRCEKERRRERRVLVAYPILTGSAAITTLSKADGFIYVEKGVEIIEEGEEVEVQLLV